MDPEYYEREPELGVGPGRPRILNSKEEFFLVMCRLRQGLAERHLGHLYNISQSTVSTVLEISGRPRRPKSLPGNQFGCPGKKQRTTQPKIENKLIINSTRLTRRFCIVNVR